MLDIVRRAEYVAAEKALKNLGITPDEFVHMTHALEIASMLESDGADSRVPTYEELDALYKDSMTDSYAYRLKRACNMLKLGE